MKRRQYGIRLAIAAVLLVAFAIFWQGAWTACEQSKAPFSVHNLVTGKLREQCN
jgi:hypothetical protein